MRVIACPLILLLLTACGGTGGDGGTVAQPETTAQAPNFVVVILDDWGWRDYGAQDAWINTPNIDAIVQQGFTFTNAFLTTSSCSPSRASILMGRYPTATGAPHLHDPVPDGFTSIPEQLRERGYYTAAMGKWHLGGAFVKRFDDVFTGSPGGSDSSWPRLLAERPVDQPFFFWLASVDPHVPHAAAQTFRVHDPAAVQMPDYLADTPEGRAAYAAYLDEVHQVDFYIGELINALHDGGLLVNTWLFVLADNGAPTPFAKTTLYDSGIKTPLLVLGPGVSGSYDGLVSSVDLAPTIVELAGIDIPAAFQGRSFRRAFDAPDYLHREYVFAEQNNHGSARSHTAIRSADFLLINNYVFDWTCATEMPPLMQQLHALATAGAATDLQRLCVDRLPPVQFLRVGQPGYEANNLADSAEMAASRQLLAERLAEWESEFRSGACVTADCARAALGE